MAPATLDRYRTAYLPWRRWCEVNGLCHAPASERTMIAYLDQWRQLPVHHNGCRCGEHRPSPPTALSWLCAVKFWHRIGDPPLPWEGGYRLTHAILTYCWEAQVGGWETRHAVRAFPQDVRDMVDALDARDPKERRDRALVLTTFYAAAGATQLANLRIRDVEDAPDGRGVYVHLRTPDMYRHGVPVRRGTDDPRLMLRNVSSPAYCGVAALRAYMRLLEDEGVVRGALFRPFDKWSNLMRGDQDAPEYRMVSTAINYAVRRAAALAGLPNADALTPYSLRRGRAEAEAEAGVDPFDIAAAYGWAGPGSIDGLLRRLDRPRIAEVGVATQL